MSTERLDSIAARMQSYRETGFQPLVLDPSLLVMAAGELLEAFAGWDGEENARIDVGRVYTVAWVHFARIGALEERLRDADTHAAVRLFDLVGQADEADVPEEARAAVEALRQRDATHPVSPIAESLHRHALVHMEAFQRTHSFACLDAAVTLWRAAVRTSSLALLPRYLSNLGAALALRAPETAAEADWDAAVAACRDAVEEARALDRIGMLAEGSVATYLASLGLVHRLRFLENGREEDRTASIETYRAAVAAAKGDPDLSAELSKTLRDTFGETSG